ncbi:hypothetical protein [Brachybacterium sacelli]|uniref:hypothetical protein n=1 Tax=Brachybacterium sacelli TaxID=173364 RepID=UPI0036242DA7
MGTAPRYVPGAPVWHPTTGENAGALPRTFVGSGVARCRSESASARSPPWHHLGEHPVTPPPGGKDWHTRSRRARLP